ncbi:MAG: DUF4974 domain-containing protein [Solitalea sp.]
MSPDPERIEALLLKFIHDDLSEQERIELEAYVSQAPWLKKLYDELQEDPFLTIDMHTFSRIPLQVPRIQDLGTRQRADHPENPAGTFRIKRGILAACAALFLLAVSAYLILHFYNGDVFENRTPRYRNTIAAGTNRAILTTDNGQSFVLEADSDELVASRGNVRIKKLADGTLLYQADRDPGSRASGEYNTVRTPQGGQYRVILPDSSIVRLNAVSSLRFPVVFGDRERIVEVEGEAYFDVRHDPDRPFQVVLPGGARIEVLGTSFNVKAYRDEPAIKTTLASGTIRMHSGDREILLRPGQQALLPITKPESIRLETDVNLEAETSWKDGYFQFEDMALDDIMRQIARWYDVEIVYENRISKRFNILNLSRSVPLERLLELLEMTGHVKFSIEERTVTVMR